MIDLIFLKDQKRSVATRQKPLIYPIRVLGIILQVKVLVKVKAYYTVLLSFYVEIVILALSSLFFFQVLFDPNNCINHSNSFTIIRLIYPMSTIFI